MTLQGIEFAARSLSVISPTEPHLQGKMALGRRAARIILLLVEVSVTTRGKIAEMGVTCSQVSVRKSLFARGDFLGSALGIARVQEWSANRDPRTSGDGTIEKMTEVTAKECQAWVSLPTAENRNLFWRVLVRGAQSMSDLAREMIYGSRRRMVGSA